MIIHNYSYKLRCLIVPFLCILFIPAEGSDVDKVFVSKKIGYNVTVSANYARVRLEADEEMPYYLNCLKGTTTLHSLFLRTNREYLVDIRDCNILSFYHPVKQYQEPKQFRIVVDYVQDRESRILTNKLTKIDKCKEPSVKQLTTRLVNPSSCKQVKDLYKKLAIIQQMGKTVFGYCDEFLRGRYPDGTYWQPTNLPFPNNEIKLSPRYAGKSDTLQSDQLREYGIWNAATGVQLTNYLSVFIVEKNGGLEYVSRGDADYWGEECKNVLKKYFDKTHGVIILTCSLYNPWDYQHHGIKGIGTHPDIWEEILNKDNPYHEVSEGYLKRVINRLTSFINDLKDKNGEKIPVVVRPLGELDSNFWWCYGQTSRENIIKGYKVIVDFIKAQCDNVLYDFSILSYSAGNGVTYSVLSDLYPGDDYCDIIGFSHYIDGTAACIQSGLNVNKELQRFCKQHKKLIAMTETGNRNLKYDHTFVGDNSVLQLMTMPEFKSCYSLCWYQHRQGFHIPFTSDASVSLESSKQYNDFRLFLNSSHILDAEEFRKIK